MKLVSVLFAALFSFNLFAIESTTVPVVTEAIELYLENKDPTHVLRPDLLQALKILKTQDLDPAYLQRILNKSKFVSELPEKDEYDLMIENLSVNSHTAATPAISLHSYKLDVARQSDVLGDNIYAYYFMTDGVIPTGKVTSVYKGTRSGQGFFFNEIDRAIFPLAGISAKVPRGHLIVDYGIIESDGDDIKQMQKLSAILIDLAIAIYTSQNPEGGEVLGQMRREIKALADLLLELNNDDRLVTGSFAYKNQEITDLLKDTTFYEFSQRKHSGATFGGFDYTLHFRMLR